MSVELSNGRLGVSPEKIQDHMMRKEAIARASHEPCPGPIADAFGEDDIPVKTASGIVRVRPIVHADIILLKRLDSPLYRQMQEAYKEVGSRDETNVDDEESCEICFQFTRPCREARTLLSKGRDEFREAALQAISDLHNPAEITQILKAVAEQVKRMFETALKYAEPDEKGSFPKAEEEPMTASAGG